MIKIIWPPKPHIDKDCFGMWRCMSFLYMGLGSTPKKAFDDWERVMLESRMFQNDGRTV